MARMSTAEKLKLKYDLSRVLTKQLSCSQRTVLQKLGIYCDVSKTVNLDFHGFEDSMLWQLRRELRNLVGSNGDGKEEDGKVDDDEEASKKKKADGKEDDDDDDAASKKKALRAAILKSRFAETIWKANNGGRSDPDRERERLERLRSEEELKKIEIREEAELKRKREQQMNEEREAIKRRRQQQINKEREAARMALELVEKNVDVDDNWKVMKDLEMLINCCSADDDYQEFRHSWLWRQMMMIDDDYQEPTNLVKSRFANILL